MILVLLALIGGVAAHTFGTSSILINRGALTLDFGEWYGRSSAVTAAIVAALVVAAFCVSLGRRHLWDAAALERHALPRASTEPKA